jgi:hypothetical protein
MASKVKTDWETRDTGHAVEINQTIADAFNIREEPGWVGFFSRQEAPQAKYKNGARIKKFGQESSDQTAHGTGGWVLGSIYQELAGVAYFVEWDDKPRHAIFIVEARISG